MAIFQYRALDKTGNQVKGMVEAPDGRSAAKILRDKELFVVDISESQAKTGLTGVSLSVKRVGFNDIVMFTRQLATMMVAGLQIPEALEILEIQVNNPNFSHVINDIKHQVMGGSTLANALSRHEQNFSAIYIALIRAGEASGTLDQVLARLAENMESQQEFRAKIKGAMVYPIIILIGMFAVIVIMLTVVIPKLTELYRDFGTTLPWSTQLLMTMSDVVIRFWWLLAIVGVGGTAAFLRWKKTLIGQFVIDSVILKLPLSTP